PESDQSLPESQRLYQWNTLSGHRLARAAAYLTLAEFIYLVQLRLNMYVGPLLIVSVKSIEFFKNNRPYRFFAMNFVYLSTYGPANRNVKLYEAEAKKKKNNLSAAEKAYLESTKPGLLDEIIKAALRKHVEVPLTEAQSHALERASHFTVQRRSKITADMIGSLTFEHKNLLPALTTHHRYAIKNNPAIPNDPDWMIHTYFRPDQAAFDYSVGPENQSLSTLLWQLARYMSKDCIKEQNTICKQLFPPDHKQKDVGGSHARSYFRPEMEPMYLRVSGPSTRYMVYRLKTETEFYYAHPRHMQKDRALITDHNSTETKKEE